MNTPLPTVVMKRRADYWQAGFTAMASPCEVLVDCDSQVLAQRLGQIAAREAARIECKFSRYRADNIVWQVNHANGKEVLLDAETARLLHYADDCYRLSDGRFDITSGVLRRVWRFDGGDQVPDAGAIRAVLESVGWSRVSLGERSLSMPVGMEIDFGGIGKEYAVDRALSMILANSDVPVLVNFGGDLACSGHRQQGQPWIVGMECAAGEARSGSRIELSGGGLATSGDAHRFVMHEGRRLGHVLDPRTGWPVEGAPNAVTVAAATCTEAGMLATFALLRGKLAERFLEGERARYWIDRAPRV